MGYSTKTNCLIGPTSGRNLPPAGCSSEHCSNKNGAETRDVVSCMCSTFLRMNTYSTCQLKQVANRARGRLPWNIVKLDKPQDVHVASLDGARET